MAEEKQIQHAERIRTERILADFFQQPRGTLRKWIREGAAVQEQAKQIALQIQGPQKPKYSTEVTSTEQSLKPSTPQDLTEANRGSQLGGSGASGGRHLFIFNNNGIDEYWSVVSNFDSTV